MSSEDDGEIITLTVTATLKQVGMEMRHLVEALVAHQQREPDRSLLRVLARAHRFRDQILCGGRKTLADVTAVALEAAATAYPPGQATGGDIESSQQGGMGLLIDGQDGASRKSRTGRHHSQRVS